MSGVPIPSLGAVVLAGVVVFWAPGAFSGIRRDVARPLLEVAARSERGSGKDSTAPGTGSRERPGRSQDAPDAQRQAESEPHPGERLTVYLLTVGQGDAIWERFSHNAIWIRDEESGWEAAFNWGIFDFGQVDFIPRLIRGTMLYRLEPWDPMAYLEETRRENRAAWSQELALTPEEKWELLTYVEWNAQPENKYYRYDYYRDNCSTRVRDALDRVVGGRIRAGTEPNRTTHTYRWHTRRLLQDAPAAYLGIQTVLGPAADRPLTEWEEAFLPLRLMESVRHIEVPDGEGGMRPLVMEERQLLHTTRPPVPARPPNAFPWFFLVGLLWGGGILALSRRGGRLGLPGRLALSTLAGGWALLATLAGTLLLGAWLFTDHTFWYKNQNLLQLNPLFLPVAGSFLLFPFRGAYSRWARNAAVGLGAIAGVGLLASLFPGTGQANGEILALTLPLNGALAVGSIWLHSSAAGFDETPREHEEESHRESGKR